MRNNRAMDIYIKYFKSKTYNSIRDKDDFYTFNIAKNNIILFIYLYIFGTNTRNRARPRTYSKLWSA